MRALFFIVFLSGGCAALAQEVKEFSLKEAQDYAVKNGYTTRMADLDVETAKKTVWATKAIGLPQVSGSAQYQNYIDIPTQIFPDFFGGTGALVEAQFGLPQTMTAGISGSQLLFDGSYIVGLQVAKDYMLQAENGLRKSEIEVKHNVTTAYYTALVAERNIEILAASKKTLDRNLFETTEMYNSGLLKEEDADQLKLLVANTESSISYAEQQHAIALNLLKFQMGIPIDEQVKLKDKLDGVLGEETEVDGSKFSPAGHIDYKIISTNERLSYLSLRNERAKSLPSLSTFISYSQNAFRNEFSFFDGSEKWYPTTVWGLSLQVPIFSSFMRQANIQKGKIEFEKAQIQTKQVEESLKLEYRTASAEYNHALAQYNNSRESMELAKKIREKTQIRYKEGMASSLELSQAENQFLTAEGSYIQSLFQLLNAKSRLDKILNNY